ncbi:MAG: hypothetical protein ABI566_08575 [Pseudolysinimonas sp.]
MRSGQAAAVAIPLVLLALLAGCGGEPPEASPAPSASETETPTPTPTPEPTAPAAADLVLTTSGMGTLEFGVAPSTDPVTQMIAVDPAACAEFWPVGSPEASRPRPIAAYGGSTTPMFGVVVLDGVLTRIDLFTPDIPTDAGIRIGSTAADVSAAYPSATVTTLDLTDVVTVADEHGTLMIEIARERGLFDTAYWDAGVTDRVVYVRGTVAGTATFTVVASENIAGGCL